MTVLALLTAAVLAAQSADEIIKKNMDAQGGAEKLDAIKTLQLTGKAVIGGKLDAPLIYRSKRPLRYRTEITIQGKLMTEAFDGTVKWTSDGQHPTKFPDENTRDATDGSDPIGSPLFNYKEKGNSVELVGKETVDGQACFKFNVKLKSGNTAVVYVDQKSYLTFKLINRSGELEAESRPNDYRQVGNVLLPFSNNIRIKGQDVMRYQYDKAEINVPMDDSLFTMPAKK